MKQSGGGQSIPGGVKSSPPVCRKKPLMNVDRHKSFPTSRRSTARRCPRRLATLVEASPLAIVTFDPKASSRCGTRLAERISGGRNEALGTRLPFVPRPRGRRSSRASPTRPPWECSTEPELHRRRARRIPIVRKRRRPPPSPAGRDIYGILTILMDVTEQKSTGTRR